jgi:DNA invertase Pin-like site-specific DNA recombinase
MTRVGNARVSTPERHMEGQALRPREEGCERVFTDVASGRLASRPG